MKFRIAFVLAFVVLTSGCLLGPSQDSRPILLATTTSTYDSGLLDYLLPRFEETYGFEVRVTSVGTGQAIELGRKGDVDVILVHSPNDEMKFIDEGFGLERNCVMYNDFVILGPIQDPAKIKGLPVLKAMQGLTGNSSIFVSRGDGSGTHKKEMMLWREAGVEEKGSNYIEAAVGMGQTLLLAEEKRAYTLSDRSTFLSMKDKLDLVIMVQGDTLLLNPYSIIAINPEKHPRINSDGADKLIKWMMDEKTQKMIEEFTKEGETLFTPLYGSCLENP